MRILFSKTTEDFIKEASKLHNNRYSYEKVNYINALDKVIITCPKHGDFLQTPNHHLGKKGCPICSNSGGELIIYD